MCERVMAEPAADVDHGAAVDRLDRSFAMWRHVQACEGLASLLQAASCSTDKGVVDLEGLGDLLQTLALDMRRVAEQVEKHG